MTAMKLESNSFVKQRVISNIIENKKLAILSCVFNLLGLPVIMLGGVLSEYSDRNNNYNSFFSFFVIGTICLIIAVFLGILLALNMFKYQYKKHYVDMNLSLPLSTKQRFLCDFLSGLGIYIIPLIVSWIISNLVMAFGIIGLDLIDLKEMWSMINCSILAGMVGMILLYVFFVFSTTCSGNIFEAISGAILLNHIVPIFWLCLGLIINNGGNKYGISSTTDLFLQQLYCTSPIGVVSYTIINIMNSVNEKIPAGFFLYILTVVAITVALTFLTYFLYKRRKAEKVGLPYVIKSFYYVLISISAFCFLSLFNMVQEIVLGVFVCGIFYFLFEIITLRGFKKFYLSIARYFATILGFLCIILISKASNGFGLYKYTPNPSSVSSVTIQSYGSKFYIDSQFTDESIIKAVVELQEKYIDQYDNSQTYNFQYVSTDDNSPQSRPTETAYIDNSVNISIDYNLKSGNTISREYSINCEDIYNLQNTIYNSDEWVDISIANLSDFIYKSNVPNSFSFIFDSIIDLDEEDGFLLSQSEVDELKEAYKKDLLDMTEQDYRTANVIGDFGYSNQVLVYSCNTNTIEFISTYYPEVKNLATELTNENIVGLSIQMFKDGVNADQIFNNGDYEYERLSKYYTTRASYLESQNNNPVTYIMGTNETNPELLELINVARNNYRGTEIAGIISINNIMYVVPTEYEELFDKVYNKYFVSEVTLDDEFNG